MQEKSRKSLQMDAKIQMALSHPRRTEIFRRLMQQKSGMSENQLASEFGMVVRVVEYHLKVLHDAALIARLDEGQEPAAAPSYVATSTF